MPPCRNPPPRNVPHTWQRPTGPVDDPWAWLRDRDDPATIAYLEAENAYSDAWFAAHAGLVDELFDELRSRVQETDLSAPVRKGEWWYVSPNRGGRQLPDPLPGRTRGDGHGAR